MTWPWQLILLTRSPSWTVAGSLSRDRHKKSWNSQSRKPPVNCWQPCLDSLSLRRCWSNDALLAAPARSRLALIGWSVCSYVSLHGLGSRNVLRRNAYEPADCAGDNSSVACSIRSRQTASSSICILVKFLSSRRDGIFFRLQQSRSATSAGARAEHAAPDNHIHAACLGDRSATRDMERGTYGATAGPLALLGNRDAIGNPRPGACSCTLGACCTKRMVSDGRNGVCRF